MKKYLNPRTLFRALAIALALTAGLGATHEAKAYGLYTGCGIYGCATVPLPVCGYNAWGVWVCG